jgi:hypothetical protein
MRPPLHRQWRLAFPPEMAFGDHVVTISYRMAGRGLVILICAPG